MIHSGQLPKLWRQQLLHSGERPNREPKSSDAASTSNQEAFREHLPNETHPPAANRDTNGKLLLPADRSSHHQHRDISACDQKDQSHGSQEQNERSAHVANQSLAKRSEVRRVIRVLTGVCGTQAIADHVHLFLSFGKRSPFTQASGDREEVSTA